MNSGENGENRANASLNQGNISRKPKVMMTEPLFNQIKRLISQSVPVAEIVNITGLGKSAVYNALQKINENPSFSFSELYSKAGRKNLNYDEILGKLKSVVNEDQSLTQHGISTKIEETHGSMLKQPQVCKLLKKAGLTRKRLKKKAAVVNTESHAIKVREYARGFLAFRSREILFLDETGFNLHTSINYGYSEVGISPVTYVPPSKGQNLSACCIISQSGLIHYKLIDGGFNGTTFMDYLVELSNNRILKSGVVLVLDNAPIHKTIVVREFLERIGVIVSFLPPYSPDFNPIENFFSSVKSRLHAIRPRAETRDRLKENVINVLEGFKNANEVNIFINLVGRMWELIYSVLSSNE